MTFDVEAHEVVNHQTLAVTSTAQSLTDPGENVTAAEISVWTADVRWRADGTAPTASVGEIQEAGTRFRLTKEEEIANFQVINKDGIDAEINIIYYTGKP